MSERGQHVVFDAGGVGRGVDARGSRSTPSVLLIHRRGRASSESAALLKRLLLGARVACTGGRGHEGLNDLRECRSHQFVPTVMRVDAFIRELLGERILAGPEEIRRDVVERRVATSDEFLVGSAQLGADACER
jgi:hypothetical protein